MQCVIPAAGRGVRFNELGKNYPKCVLPFQEIPIIVHNIRFAFDAGARIVTIVTGHQGHRIIEIVKMYFPDDERIRFEDYVHIGNGGPAVSIYCGLSTDLIAQNEPVLVLLSDIIVQTVPDMWFAAGSASWISVQKVPDWERWCMAVDDGERIVAFHDKPEEKPPTNLAVSGVYYFANGTFFRECLHEAIYGARVRDGEIQISYAMTLYTTKEEIKAKEIKIKDFGTLQEYLENRGIKNSREFNQVHSTDHGTTISKSSISQPAKIHAEMNWYENLPLPIKLLTPRILEKNPYGQPMSGRPYYKMERIDSPTLRELYLYVESDPLFWTEIYNKLFGILDKFHYYFKPGVYSQFFTTVAKKNWDRLRDMEHMDIMIHDCDREFLNKFDEMVNDETLVHWSDSLSHGDFCFSNIFYHPGSKQIKLIDPRGDAYGNILYDLAKLTHSAYYPYDYIDAELYVKKDGDIIIFDAGKEAAREAYKTAFIAKYGEDVWRLTLFLTASLFLSMIPLHDHNGTNQEVFYALYRKAATDSGFVQ